MKLEKSLEQWTAQGIISVDQAAKIRSYEQEHASASWVLFGISGLGVLVLLTGIVSTIAANWDAISPTSKLTLYFISLIVLGWFALRRSATPGVLREILFTAFSFYVLAGIGLIGQIFHLESDGYSALFFWVTITLPIALVVQSRLVCNAWFLGLATALTLWGMNGSQEMEVVKRGFVILAVPYLFLGVGYGLGHLLSDYFASAARLWSYVAILVPFAIMGNIIWAVGDAPLKLLEYSSQCWPIPVIAAGLALGGVALRRIQPGSFLTGVISATIIASCFLILPPVIARFEKHDIFGCVLFLLTWAGAAAIAAGIERRRLFDLAALVIGIRFIVVYFEMFGSLAATGLGLIISGCVILGIAYLWHTYRGKLAIAIQERV